MPPLFGTASELLSANMDDSDLEGPVAPQTGPPADELGKDYQNDRSKPTRENNGAENVQYNASYMLYMNDNNANLIKLRHIPFIVIHKLYVKVNV